MSSSTFSGVRGGDSNWFSSMDTVVGVCAFTATRERERGKETKKAKIK